MVEMLLLANFDFHKNQMVFTYYLLFLEGANYFPDKLSKAMLLLKPVPNAHDHWHGLGIGNWVFVLP